MLNLGLYIKRHTFAVNQINKSCIAVEILEDFTFSSKSTFINYSEDMVGDQKDRYIP